MSKPLSLGSSQSNYKQYTTRTSFSKSPKGNSNKPVDFDEDEDDVLQQNQKKQKIDLLRYHQANYLEKHVMKNSNNPGMSTSYTPFRQADKQFQMDRVLQQFENNKTRKSLTDKKGLNMTKSANFKTSEFDISRGAYYDERPSQKKKNTTHSGVGKINYKNMITISDFKNHPLAQEAKKERVRIIPISRKEDQKKKLEQYSEFINITVDQLRAAFTSLFQSQFPDQQQIQSELRDNSGKRVVGFNLKVDDGSGNFRVIRHSIDGNALKTNIRNKYKTEHEQNHSTEEIERKVEKEFDKIVAQIEAKTVFIKIPHAFKVSLENYNDFYTEKTEKDWLEEERIRKEREQLEYLEKLNKKLNKIIEEEIAEQPKDSENLSSPKKGSNPTAEGEQDQENKSEESSEYEYEYYYGYSDEEQGKYRHGGGQQYSGDDDDEEEDDEDDGDDYEGDVSPEKRKFVDLDRKDLRSFESMDGESKANSKEDLNQEKKPNKYKLQQKNSKKKKSYAYEQDDELEKNLAKIKKKMKAKKAAAEKNESQESVERKVIKKKNADGTEETVVVVKKKKKKQKTVNDTRGQFSQVKSNHDYNPNNQKGEDYSFLDGKEVDPDEALLARKFEKYTPKEKKKKKTGEGGEDEDDDEDNNEGGESEEEGESDDDNEETDNDDDDDEDEQSGNEGDSGVEEGQGIMKQDDEKGGSQEVKEGKKSKKSSQKEESKENKKNKKKKKKKKVSKLPSGQQDGQNSEVQDLDSSKSPKENTKSILKDKKSGDKVPKSPKAGIKFDDWEESKDPNDPDTKEENPEKNEDEENNENNQNEIKEKNLIDQLLEASSVLDNAIVLKQRDKDPKIPQNLMFENDNYKNMFERVFKWHHHLQLDLKAQDAEFDDFYDDDDDDYSNHSDDF